MVSINENKTFPDNKPDTRVRDILTFNRDSSYSRYKYDEEVSLHDRKIQRPYNLITVYV
jgi:hypothetical protein